jgi:hypothetical protein
MSSILASVVKYKQGIRAGPPGSQESIPGLLKHSQIRPRRKNSYKTKIAAQKVGFVLKEEFSISYCLTAVVADDAALLELGARRAGEPKHRLHRVRVGKQTMNKTKHTTEVKNISDKVEILQQYKGDKKPILGKNATKISNFLLLERMKNCRTLYCFME